MAALIRDHVGMAGPGMALAVVLIVLGLLLAACAPVNAPDPVAAKQRFRADLAGFCLRNPETVGCERFTNGAR